MSFPADRQDDCHDRTILEGTARVVAVEHGLAWLEPDQTTSCGGCKAAKVCGVDAGSPRLVARRFSMPNAHDLHVGERVVVGIEEGTVLRASAILYGVPLLTLLAGGLVAQKVYGMGDLGSAAAAIAGLLAGLMVVRLLTRRSSARGDHAPRFIRRDFGPPHNFNAGPGDDCHPSDG
jgi:sigma-E factor negative regulatory protein RseC